MTYYEPLDPKELAWRNAVGSYQREQYQSEQRQTLRHFLMVQMEAELGDSLRHPPPPLALPDVPRLTLPNVPEPNLSELSKLLPQGARVPLPEIPDVIPGPRPKHRKSRAKS